MKFITDFNFTVYKNKFKNLGSYIIKRKFLFTTLFFVFWILLFDQNSILSRMRDLSKLYKLENEKQFYLNKISDDSTKLYELKTNNDNLIKYAREQYLMKEANEDVFLIKESEK